MSLTATLAATARILSHRDSDRTVTARAAGIAGPQSVTESNLKWTRTLSHGPAAGCRGTGSALGPGATVTLRVQVGPGAGHSLASGRGGRGGSVQVQVAGSVVTVGRAFWTRRHSDGPCSAGVTESPPGRDSGAR